MQRKDGLGYIGKLRLFQRDAKLYIAIFSLGSFSFGISGVIFNLYLTDAGFSEDFIGFFLSISMFATAGIAFVAGLLTDRASRKKIILA
ncbi:MFS transporter, partial [Candidatus Thorarchaeota archaeon]